MRIQILTATLLATFGTLSAAQALDLRIAGDASSWHVASDATDGGVRTVELLRPGRNFGNSPELLTIVRAPGDDASTAAEEYLSDKRSACDDGHYEFVRSGWEDTIYSWDPRGCDAPEADLDEVGRVFVSGGQTIRITIQLRDTGRLSFWESWIASGNAAYRSWSGTVLGSGASGSRSASKFEDPGPVDCADDDIDCLVAAQKRNLKAMQAAGSASNSGKSSGSRSGSGSVSTFQDPGPDNCADDDIDCLVAAQKRNLEAMQVGGTSGRSGSRAGSPAPVAPSVPGCCTVHEVRALQMQRENPLSGRTGDVSRFLSTDTYIHAVADLRGNQAGSTVTFRWVKLDGDGEEHEITSHAVTIESGNSWVYGSFFYNGLTPVGRYRVHLYFDGIHAGSRDFQVVAGSHFG